MKNFMLIAILFFSIELRAGCDMCTLYLGMHPNQTKNSIGLRYRLSEYNLASAHNHGGNNHTNNIKEIRIFQTTELWAQYMPMTRWQIIAVMPYSMNSVEQNNLVIDSYNNIGDLQIINRYLVYRSDDDDKYQKQISVGLGIKAPTGVYNEKSRAGTIDPHVQNGSGSWDMLLNTAFLIKNDRYGFNQELNLKINTKNKNEYQFANRYSSASTIFLLFKHKRISIQPSLSGMIEFADYDHSNSMSVYFSNGLSVYAQAGIDIYYKKFIINVNSSMPAYEKLNDSGAENVYRIGLGVNYVL
ncbi:MAG: hypothetical protein ACK45U_04295 [bacterium]